LESGETFSIQYISNAVKSSLDIELVPPVQSIRDWSVFELEALKEELWAVMKEEFEQVNMRSKLAALIKNPLIGDNFQAADVISRISGKNVSQRSIQAWLIEPEKNSSRKCPGWAVSALEQYLAEPENQKRLRDLVNYYKATGPVASATPAESRAEIRLETVSPNAEPVYYGSDSRREEWLQTPLSELPARLFEMEQRMNAYINYFSQTLNAITVTVLEEDHDLNAIRRSLRDKLDELRQVEMMLRFNTPAGINPPSSRED
jgi:hypothetical protein